MLSYYSATCGPSILSVGSYSKDRDVRVSVVYDHGAWRVVHTLSNGHVYERGVQYELGDATTSFNDGSTKPTWTGVLRRNSSISMTGSLGMRGATLTYDETMVQGGQTIMASEATCRLDGAPPLSYALRLPPPPLRAPGRRLQSTPLVLSRVHLVKPKLVARSRGQETLAQARNVAADLVPPPSRTA